MLNKVMVIGNLGQDPTSIGDSACRFSVAATEKWKDQNGNLQEHTEWFNVTVNGKQSHACLQYLAKGRKVFVEGRQRTTKKVDENGVERVYVNLRADRVQFLSYGEQGGGQRGDHQAQGANHQGGGHQGGGYSPEPEDDYDIPF